MTGPDPRDADLVDLARGQSEEAYLTLVSRYKGIVASAIYSLLPDAREAEEICADAFAEAWRKLDDLRAAEAFGGWVRKIARRLTLRRLRERSRERRARRATGAARDGGGTTAVAAPPESTAARTDVADLAAGPGSDPSAQYAIRDLYERVALELSRLPAVYRDAVGLRYFDGLTCKEIAATLRLPIGTVTMRLSRGSRLLRSRLAVALKDYLDL
jgi:RNA polymerase sigma-70 factor (ECF subfamily)